MTTTNQEIVDSLIDLRAHQFAHTNMLMILLTYTAANGVDLSPIIDQISDAIAKVVEEDSSDDKETGKKAVKLSVRYLEEFAEYLRQQQLSIGQSPHAD